MADVTISGLSQSVPNNNTAVIPYSDGTTTYKTSPSGIVAASPGALLQVVQAYKTNRWSMGGAGTQDIWYDVPGLAVSIILKNPNSKILVSGTINFSRDCQSNDAFLKLLRNNESVGNSEGGVIGFAAGQNTYYQPNPVTFSFLDIPREVINNYKIQALLKAPTCTMFVNVRGINDSSSLFTLTSNLTLMEIAG
jgi:hypothetical protein